MKSLWNLLRRLFRVSKITRHTEWWNHNMLIGVSLREIDADKWRASKQINIDTRPSYDRNGDQPWINAQFRRHHRELMRSLNSAPWIPRRKPSDPLTGVVDAPWWRNLIQ